MSRRRWVHYSADGTGTACRRYLIKPTAAVSWTADPAQVSCPACLTEVNAATAEPANLLTSLEEQGRSADHLGQERRAVLGA